MKEGTVDYIGFSYYMTFCIEHKKDNPCFDYREGNDFVRNSYVKANDWGWQIRSGRSAVCPELVCRSVSGTVVYCRKWIGCL